MRYFMISVRTEIVKLYGTELREWYLGVNEMCFLRLTNFLSILRHTNILFKRFTPIYRKNFGWMVPGIITKRFECCDPGLFNIHNGFNISVNRFYFVANLHGMISLIGVRLDSEAVINGNYIFRLSNCYEKSICSAEAVQKKERINNKKVITKEHIG
jgi:hypothetical protein